MEREKELQDHIVYFVRDGHGFVKIGLTSNIYTRMHDLQSAHAEPLEYYFGIKVEDRYTAMALESALHRDWKESHVRGEWYKEDSIIAWINTSGKSVDTGEYKIDIAD